MKGLLLLFVESYVGGAGLKVVVNGVPNEVYSQGLERRDMWEELYRRFGKERGEQSSMSSTEFYAGDKFGLFLDLRSMDDNKLHGSGIRMVNTKYGVQLEIQRVTSGSGTVKCHIYILSDAQFCILNSELESVQY